MTKQEAITLHDSEFWKGMSQKDIATFQLTEERLCMPFEVFQKAMESTLGRPVFTHEFGLNRDGLTRELLDGAEAPSLAEIMELIPKKMRLVVIAQRASQEEVS